MNEFESSGACIRPNGALRAPAAAAGIHRDLREDVSADVVAVAKRITVLGIAPFRVLLLILPDMDRAGIAVKDVASYRIVRAVLNSDSLGIVGEHVANNTLDISFSDTVLFLTLKSAALKQELSFNKQKIIHNSL